ncbi:hypothetical protein ACOSQ3_018532 [Xanthoceras sorbifolium]
MACCCSCFSTRCFPQIAETLAILPGLRLVEELLLLPARLNSDALSIVNLISSSTIPNSELGLLISDIVELLANPLFVGVSFIPRSANFVAHDLTSLAFSFNVEQVWIGCSPPSVER